ASSARSDRTATNFLTTCSGNGAAAVCVCQRALCKRTAIMTRKRTAATAIRIFRIDYSPFQQMFQYRREHLNHPAGCGIHKTADEVDCRHRTKDSDPYPRRTEPGKLSHKSPPQPHHIKV